MDHVYEFFWLFRCMRKVLVFFVCQMLIIIVVILVYTLMLHSATPLTLISELQDALSQTVVGGISLTFMSESA